MPDVTLTGEQVKIIESLAYTMSPTRENVDVLIAALRASRAAGEAVADVVEAARRVIAYHGYGPYGDLTTFAAQYPGDWTLPGGPDVHEPLADAIAALGEEAPHA